MMTFNADVENLYVAMEDVANALLDNEEVKAYFKEYYNYEPGVDDAVLTLLEYMNDKYSFS